VATALSVFPAMIRFSLRRYAAATRENVIKFLALDTENPNSIVSCLRAARENSRTVREAISSEMWEQVNTSYLAINAAASNPLLIHSPYSFFNEVKKASQLFDGVAERRCCAAKAGIFSAWAAWSSAPTRPRVCWT